MKKLIWKLIIPLTIISFTFFTKWWFVLPIDAPDSLMHGFPLIWSSPGWHTSMSLQIFVLELFFDFTVFLIFWFVLIFLVNRFIFKIKLTNIFTFLLIILSGTILTLTIWVGTWPDHIYYLKRDIEIEVLDSGYKFIWKDKERPILKNYQK